MALVARRVRTYVEANAGDATNVRSAETAADATAAPVNTEALVTEATARVVAALPRCASRSVQDFERWLARQIADAIDVDPENGPPSPTPPSAAAQVSASWALHTLPIPRAQRDALVHAVLEALTPPERAILEAMRDPKASWVDVASRFGLSMLEAKRLHRDADDRAHQVAVQFAARAAGLTPAPEIGAAA